MCASTSGAFRFCCCFRLFEAFNVPSGPKRTWLNGGKRPWGTHCLPTGRCAACSRASGCGVHLGGTGARRPPRPTRDRRRFRTRFSSSTQCAAGNGCNWPLGPVLSATQTATTQGVDVLAVQHFSAGLACLPLSRCHRGACSQSLCFYVFVFNPRNFFALFAPRLHPSHGHTHTHTHTQHTSFFKQSTDALCSSLVRAGQGRLARLARISRSAASSCSMQRAARCLRNLPLRLMPSATKTATTAGSSTTL